MIDDDNSQARDNILSFWFGAISDDAITATEKSRLWWSKHPEIDRDIKKRFEPCVQAAASGRLDAWAGTPTGRLALIVLTDQFPRNMYRDTPQAFGFDPMALAWSRDGIRAGMQQSLRPVQRVFFYLPLEHSELLEDQRLSVALFRDLCANADARHRPVFEGFLDYAVRHHDVIERFGRFPHRNRILGRESTMAELEFLKRKGASF